MECRKFILLFLASLLSILKNASTTTTWNMPRPVRGYRSYLDLSPVKYHVPAGLSHMRFFFHAARNHKECEKKEIHISIEHNGLPLVRQTNFSFPDNFVVTDSPTLNFSLSMEHLVGITIVRPPPGAWFIIAYFESTDDKIQQKGLESEVNCVYSYISRLELGKPIVHIPVNYNTPNTAVIDRFGSIFSFSVPSSTESFRLQVEKCDPEPCNLTLTYIPFKLRAATFKTCTDQAKDCWIQVPSPPLGDLQVVEIKYEGDGPATSQKITFNVSIKDCVLLPAPASSTCVSLPMLDRIQSLEPFNSMFGFIEESLVTFVVNVAMGPIVVVPFEILDPNDVGSSLKWRMQLANMSDVSGVALDSEISANIVVHICGALLYDYLPDMSSDFDICANISDSLSVDFRLGEDTETALYVPYPRIGQWHIVLQSTCLDRDSGMDRNCPNLVIVDTALETVPCKDKDCDGKGSCMFTSTGSDLVTFAACSCDANYQGYACTDDTNAQSVSVQLAGAYLLTMSNLFFIPAIVIGVRRRYLIEAFVYFYNMFFSTFYHACDGVRLEKYRMCIMKYDVLQAADFFGSACSLWFTLIAMARIRYRYITPLLQIAGPFGIIIGIVYDRTSLCVIAVPIFTGLAAIIGSWGHKMFKRKKLYPTWRRYLFFLLPGVVLAATGASVFSFLETRDNYKYVHSVWHMCIALSVSFLLPPRHPDSYGQSLNGSNMSTHLLTPITDRRSSRSTEEATTNGYANEIS